jgi:hypothetical protein
LLVKTLHQHKPRERGHDVPNVDLGLAIHVALPLSDKCVPAELRLDVRNEIFRI